MKLQVLEKKLAETEARIAMPQPDLPYKLNANQKEPTIIDSKRYRSNIRGKATGTRVRSRANWVRVGEKPTSYFLSLEKQNKNRKSIHRLRLANGNISINPTHIRNEQEKCFADLYTSNLRKVDESYLNNLVSPKVSQVQRLATDKVLDTDEIWDAIKQLQSNKSPGSDGLPIEFYRSFANKLIAFIYKVFL